MTGNTDGRFDEAAQFECTMKNKYILEKNSKDTVTPNEPTRTTHACTHSCVLLHIAVCTSTAVHTHFQNFTKSDSNFVLESTEYKGCYKLVSTHTAKQKEALVREYLDKYDAYEHIELNNTIAQHSNILYKSTVLTVLFFWKNKKNLIKKYFSRGVTSVLSGGEF